MSRKIYITEADRQKLYKLIEDAVIDDIKNKEHMRDLEKELERAEVIDAERLPRDVITMNSRVLLLLDGVEEEFTLVYPHEADITKNALSVLSPIGTAILGYREGDSVQWKVPSGTVQVEVKKVVFQPEAQAQMQDANL